MKTYVVEITIEDGYEIQANSAEEAEEKALEKVQERYRGIPHIEVNAMEKENYN